MKKLLLLLFTVLFVSVSFAQVSKQQNEFALNLLRTSGKALGLTEKDMDNLLVSATYETADGVRMIYLQQAYRGIPVFNQMLVLAFRNNKPVSQNGSGIPDIENLVNNAAAVPAIPAADAVKAALKDRKISLPNAINRLQEKNGKISFGNLGIALTDITAELVWLPVSSKDIRLTWQIDLSPQKTSDHWLIRVDAANAIVLDKNNLTVYEQFPAHTNESANVTPADNASGKVQSSLLTGSPSVVNSATYRVVPYPAESPNHAGGTPALVTDPWSFAPGNATSLKWNNDGTTYHDSTRGNNVWAQEDRDNNNNTFGKTAISTTAQPGLTFDFVPNFTVAPTTTVNQQFATTNLFYWNNIVHDLTYLYGFDEPSGNFQANNQGRGGAGNDYVIADAQDAGGTNNANFSTPVDGSRPRMQMYLFTGTTPNRDGDIDNGVVVHEYGHGISNRLTGGPANASCLGNAEQGGEGWSDYFALMATTKWSAAQITDGALARPMGTYVLGQATTGAGIRQYPYSTNMSINPWTYAMLAGTGGEVHTIGEIWCTVLWEMTWQMIAQDGINPNLFNPAATGGNSAAMKLVIEGLRLQPCSPGYIDARNAILKADTIFFAAKYSCAIWTAFAKRGMGKGASQGSSNSTTDQVASFIANGASTLLLTQNVTSQQEGLNITYTNHVSAGGCGALSNYLITDTLPSNVNYVSGGTYNSGSRVVSFPVNLAQGAAQDYSFTVQINAGSYFPPASLINETVAGSTIPSTFTATNTTGSTVWAVSTLQSHSPTRSFFAADNASAITDFRLATNTAIALGAIPPVFTFWHYYNTEAGWDGGVVEISTNGGNSWSDLGANISSNGYNGSVGGTNPIAGRSAFTGNSGGFIQTKISLLPYANQSALFRFRATSDDNTASTGWYIDDVVMNTQAVVNMRTSLFNNTGARVSYSDTVTTIMPTSCVTGTITGNPVSTTICENSTASFTVAASGTALTYQWQSSNDGGTSFSNISGQTNTTIILSNVTVSMNNYKYRCQISGTCTSITSSVATLNVNALPNAASASNASRCGAGTVTLSANSGNGETIDWYAAATGGSALLSGSASFTTPSINATTTYYAEARNTTTGCISATRTVVTATVNNNPLTPSGSNASRCGTGTVTLSANSGSSETTDWYAAATGGSALLSGSASFTTPSINATTTYYAEARNTTTGCISATRTVITATVNNNPLTPSGSNASRCGAGTVSLSATSGNGETIDWYAAATGGSALLSGSESFTTPSINATTTYYAEARNTTTGCISLTRTAVMAILNANPSAASGSGAAICEAGMVSISASPLTGETIDWYADATGGSALLSGSTSFTTPSITVTTTYYAESRTIATGCISSTRTAVTATINSATNSTTYIPICETSLPYTWNNTTFNTGGTFTVILVNSAGCDSLAKLLLDVAAAIHLQTVTGGGSYTTGGTGVAIGLSGSENGVNYQLLLEGNPVGSPVAGTNAAISFGNQLQAGTYTVLATTSLCSQLMSGSATVTITSGPPTAYAVTGGGTYCAGGAGVVVGLAGSQSGINYQLRRGNGSINVGSPVPGTGAAISFGLQTSASDYSVLATNTVSLSTQAMLNSVEVRIAAVRAPSTPGTITGPADACPYVGVSNVVYTIRQAANATSYLWTAPAGASIIGSNTDTMVVIQYPTSFISGTLSVRSVNACFSNAMSSAKTLAITRKIPSTPGTITASLSNPCSIVGTASTSTYTIAPVAFATGYTWTLSTGITLVSNAGDTGIIVRFASGFTTGTISVAAYNNCATSSARSLTVTAKIPVTPTAINGAANVCVYVGQPGSATFSIAAVNDAESYLWTAPANASIVSGQGTVSVQVSFSASFSSGSLTVKSLATCGSSAARSLSLTKTVAKPASISPSATACPSANVTYSIAAVPFATSYLWTLPTNAIYVSGQGTTSYTVNYKPTFVSGTVTVKAVNNCSTSASTSLAVSASACSLFTGSPDSKSPLTNGDDLTIYPNPSNGIFRIDLNTTETSGTITIQLVDMFGKVVKEQKESTHKHAAFSVRVNTGNLVAGTYEVRCYSGTTIKSKKVIIVK